MKRPLPHLPESVASCTPTRDGRYFILTRWKKVAHSDEPIPEGAAIRINNGVARRVGPSPSAALASLSGIDRMRGGER